MHRLVYAFLVVGVATLGLRASDYLTGDQTTTGIVEVSPDTATMWGILCAVAATMVAAGLVFRCYRLMAIAATLAASTYIMLSVFAFDAAVLSPPVDDWRFAADLLSRGITWALAAAYLVIRRDVLLARKEVT